MANEYLVNSIDITAVADAIRAKGGTSDALTFPGGFVDAVSAIRAADDESIPSVEKDVTFHDYDGTLLYEYTIEEAQALTTLPAGPAHEGLVFEGWNWSLDEVKALTYPMQIGANYITDDGATRLYLRFNTPLLHTYLKWKQNMANGVVIDWGDGSAYETFDTVNSVITAEHAYPAKGDYVIRMMPQNGCTLTLDSGTHTHGILGNRVQNIDLGSYSRRLYKVELGKNLGTMSNYAFFSSTCLETITMPANSKIFPNSAWTFSNCNNLKAFVVPSGVTHPPIMNQNYGLYVYCMPKSVTTMSGSILQFNMVPKITMPDGVVTIESNAFNSSFVKSVRIPKTVTSLGSSLFYNCVALQHIPEIPDGLNVPWAYLNESKITGDVVIKDGVTVIGGSAFRATAISSLTLPDTVKEIGSSAFQGTKITEFEWPASIETVNGYMFYTCKLLKKMRFPDNIQTIPAYFCHGCSNITDLYIPDGVMTIDTGAFEGCGCGYINIPQSVTTINAKALNMGTMLEYHFRGENPPTLADTNALAVSALCKIYVPKGSLEAYQNATNWSIYASYIQEEVE